MENDDDHVAAVAARLPPVRYYVPYEEEEEDEPVQDPDSPQSPDQMSFPFPYPPLVLLNRTQPAFVMDDDEPTPPAPAPSYDEPTPAPAPESPPAAAWNRPWPQEDDDLYYVEDEDDPVSVRKGLEVQSKRYAVLALRHYNADPCNAIKYELVQATGSNGIVLDWGGIIGHVTFTARAATTATTAPRPFFAEVRAPDLVPSCFMSLDDREEQGHDDDDGLCQFCGDALKHPKVPPELHRRPNELKHRSWGVLQAAAGCTNAKMDDCDP